MIATQSKSASRNFVAAFEYNHNKMSHKDSDKRAVLLDHNFVNYSKRDVLDELKLLKQLKPNVTRDGFHVSISFSPEDRHLSDKELSIIANEYMRAMGFLSDNNLYAIWRHEDGTDENGLKHSHQHIHILATTIGFDGSVVNLSNNYWKSQKATRELEIKYDLVQVQPSVGLKIKSPSKNEIEMVLRTNKGSDKMLLQQRLLSALESSKTLDGFIANCKDKGVYLLFNQSKSGYVSGLTYIMDNGFMANASKIGESFKWNNLKNIVNYEQDKQSESISRANFDTRERFKDLFEKRARETQLVHSNSRTKSNINQQESKYSSRAAEGIGEQRSDSGYELDSKRKSRNQETIQEVDESISSQSSSRTSTVFSTISGLFNSFGSQVGEDQEAIQKRRRKRR